MKTFILIALTFLGAISPAIAQAQPRKPKIALLTSLDTLRIASSIPWFLGFAKGQYYHYLSALEKDFRQKMTDDSYTLEVFHYADQAVLQSVLTSPEYVAVYWVSHGAGQSSSPLGDSAGGLFDSNGFELTPIFSDIHPNIQVLGLVGCRGNGIARYLDDQFKQRHSNPGIKIYAYDQTIDARKGLSAMIEATRDDLPAATQHWESYAPSQCETRRGYFVSLRRRCEGPQMGTPYEFPAVRLVSQGKVIATFNACRSDGEIQTGHAWIPEFEGNFNRSKVKLVLDSGFPTLATSKTLDIGKFEVRAASSDPIKREWHVFSKPDGTPFGTNSHVFQFSGELGDLGRLDEYHLYRCSF